METIRTKTTSSKACELKFMCNLKVVFPRKHAKLLLLVSGKTLGYVLRSVCLVLYDLSLPCGDNVPLSNKQLTDFTSKSGFEFWLSYKRSSPLCFARNFIKTKNTSFSNFWSSGNPPSWQFDRRWGRNNNLFWLFVRHFRFTFRAWDKV